MRVAVVLFLLAFVCPAQVNLTRGEEFCTLEGQIFNDATGVPLKKATVVMTGTDGKQGLATVRRAYSAVSDLTGKFVLKDVNPGKYRLTVSRSGFVTGTYGSRSPTQPGTILTLEPGQHAKDLNFRLTPHGVVAGHVVDEDGEPIPYVSVQLLRFQYRQGKRELTNAGIAVTDDRGDFRVFGVAPGKYYLKATARSEETIAGGVEHSTGTQQDDDYIPRYYPGTTDIANAVPIDVAAGTVFGGINLPLSKSTTVHVRGSVITSVGQLRWPIQLFLSPRNTQLLSGFRNDVADATGHFDLRGVMPGQYSLQAAFNDSNQNYSGQVAIDVGNSNLDNVTLTVNQRISVSGILRIDNDTAQSLSGVEIRLQQKTNGSIVGGLGFAHLKEDSTFQFQDVGADIFDVIVRGLPDGFYFKSVKSGETDVMCTGLDVTKGLPPLLEIVVSPRAGMINGSVRNPNTGQPAPGAIVVLVPQERERRSLQKFYTTTSTDQNGTYTLKNLTPGEYKVFAWEDLEPGAYMDPDFLKPIEGKGEAITIREGDHKTISLKMILAESNGRQ